MGNGLRNLKCLVLMIFFASGTVFANGSETGKIINIIAEGSGASGVVSVWLDGADYKAECTSGDRWTMQSTDAIFKEKYAALMAAAVAGKQVTLYYTTSMGCGSWNSNTIYFINTVY